MSRSLIIFSIDPLSLSDEEKARKVAHTPLGRMCTCEDLASAVLFFASEESLFVTGQVIDVNGGLRL